MMNNAPNAIKSETMIDKERKVKNMIKSVDEISISSEAANTRPHHKGKHQSDYNDLGSSN